MTNPYLDYGVSDEVAGLARKAIKAVQPAFLRIEEIREYNQLRVLRAFWNAKISDAHFGVQTGYGYDDIGREKIEQMYAEIFGAEAAYVRIQISAGTQAIALCLFGVLRPGDELLSVTGRPYDTLASAIGISEDEKLLGMGSLREYGIQYNEVSLSDDGSPDLKKIAAAISDRTKMIFIQKSKGYTTRRCLLSDDILAIVKTVRSQKPDAVIFVDNCYGEFVEKEEPCMLGADLCAGSLIKNPGGGLCPSGGYVVGRKDLIEKIASRATAPGLGSHIGPSLGFSRVIAQGLFQAPHVTAESVKGAVFAAALFEEAGYASLPSALSHRGDIVQSITFRNGQQIVDFCQAIQSCSPVDSFVYLQPWAMPGYEDEVVMAAGTFVQGASIELSADGPIKSPYTAYMQGGLVFEQVKLASMLAVQKMGVVNT